MALSNTQVQERVKAPKRKAQLVKAIRHEQWLRFHAEECLSKTDASRYLVDSFEPWVKKLLPSDKFEFFLQMLSFPVYTTELCESMQDEMNKVFDSQNSSFTYEFTSAKFEADFRAFLDDTAFWPLWVECAKASMIKNINSIVVVDMPQKADDTAPYFYFMQIDSVIDIDLNRGEITALVANQDDGKVLLVDEERYALFQRKGDKLTFQYQSFHGLGYCPATFFWKKAIRSKEPIVKSSPITPALNNLDYLVYAETARRCLEAYAAFPITVSYASDCTYYEEIDTKKYACTNGWIDTPVSGLHRCPVCEKNKFNGPGTHLQVEAPTSKDQPNNIDAVKQIPAETESLDYWTKRVAELWDEIYYDCVGTGGDTMAQAINKDQVRGNFESKQNILLKIKDNLEASHKFVIETMARLRYENAFLGCSINYGTKFYLQSVTEVQKEYQAAKDAGAPAYQLSYKRKQLDMVNTKGNDVDAQYLNILQNLEPWVDYDIDKVDELGFQAIDPKAYLLKADFSNRINRFESEHGSIIEFGSKLDFATKIKIIYEVLIEYGPTEVPVISQPAMRSAKSSDPNPKNV
jgi:hypothetical protein